MIRPVLAPRLARLQGSTTLLLLLLSWDSGTGFKMLRKEQSSLGPELTSNPCLTGHH